jgi:uncharacterized iron-regulated membrane protein
VLTFLVSLAIMYAVVTSLVMWAKRKERRQMAAHELDAIEEVLGSARDHR